jgi:hypothetical protein
MKKRKEWMRGQEIPGNLALKNLSIESSEIQKISKFVL